MGDKELALGKRYAVVYKEYHAVHSLVECLAVDGKEHAGVGREEPLVEEYFTAVHDGATHLRCSVKVVAGGYVVCTILLDNIDCCTLVLDIGQVELLLLFALFEYSPVLYILVWGDGECSFSQILGGGGEQWLAVGSDGDALLAVYAVVAEYFVCNGAFNATYKVAALGVEAQVARWQFAVHPFNFAVEAGEAVVLLNVYKESSAAVEHILEIPIVGIHLVEDREHTAEDGILATVEHVACVGAYLVISRQQQRCQLERAVAAAVALNPVFVGLYNVALGRYKFYVQHTAHCGWLVVDTAHHVCLEPDAFAKVVGGVVEVQIDALFGEEALFDGTAYDYVVEVVAWRLAIACCLCKAALQQCGEQ